MDLITSRLILGEVAKKQYEMKTDSGVSSGTLIKLLGGGKLPLRAQGPYIVGRMKRLVDVQVSPKTGVITLTVRAFTPDMAVQIANNVLSEVNTFNLNRRQQAAAGEREFVENREAEALSDLRNAEENLQSFLVQNRDFTVSPTLQLEQTLYTSLATAAEQAKIEEVRNLPVITVLAPPEAPLIPESKRGMRKVLFSLIIGAVIGAMIAFAMAGLAASTRGHPNDIAEFDRLKGETIDDIKHPWRPLVRMFSWRRRPATPV
jgi:capsule polysaccharide export protein KpsE/RkpR